MYLDLTLPITKKDTDTLGNTEPISLFGHVGTHFDCMNYSFPYEDFILEGIVFHVEGKEEITLSDIDLSQVKKDMMVLFHSGHIEQYPYGTAQYHHNHPYLSQALIDALIEKEIRLIGVDFPGIRRHKEHTPMDQYCADHGVFIIENLIHLSQLPQTPCTIYTFPMHTVGYSGIPCRVVAKL